MLSTAACQCPTGASGKLSELDCGIKLVGAGLQDLIAGSDAATKGKHDL